MKTYILTSIRLEHYAVSDISFRSAHLCVQLITVQMNVLGFVVQQKTELSLRQGRRQVMDVFAAVFRPATHTAESVAICQCETDDCNCCISAVFQKVYLHL